MEKEHRLVYIISLFIIGLGVLSLIISLFFDWNYNISWPLAVIMLGVIFCILVNTYFKEWPWGDLFYIPGAILLALGLIFLLNVVTGDWGAWAYAWLLVLAGAGIGVALSNRRAHWRRGISYIGVGVGIGGIALFVLFGAISGSIFLLVMSAIILVAGGLALLWWREPDVLLSGKWMHRFRHTAPDIASDSAPSDTLPEVNDAAEPLSARELEVLNLIDQGLSNDEVARKLTVATSTVKTHINNIYSKLGVKTRVQALKRAGALGLLSR